MGSAMALARFPEAETAVRARSSGGAARRTGDRHRRREGGRGSRLVGARRTQGDHLARRRREIYAHQVAAILEKLSPAPSGAIVKQPKGVSDGWDADDALTDGWAPAQAANLIAEANPAGRERAAASRSSKPAPRALLFDLLGEAELWHDPERVAYATAPVERHEENHELGSDGFKNWLAWRAYEATGIAPAAESIEAALRVAKGLALNRGPCCKTSRRVAEHDGRLYLDLGCPHRRAVEIAATGWRIIDTVPVKFLRSRGMEPLPEPQDGNSIKLLREFVNVESDADFRLFLAWLVTALRSTGPYPIFILIGQQGSSKSTLARIARLLIDANASPIRAVPKDERDLIVIAFNSWLLVYDNLSTVPAWLSDGLCRRHGLFHSGPK